MSALPQVALADGVRQPDGRGARLPQIDNQTPSERIAETLSFVDFDAEYWAAVKERATD